MNAFIILWKDAKTPFEYVVATWATGLFFLSVLGFGKIFYELITNPSQFDHVTWGLIDYIP